ncbi:hypothetical protein KPH14_008164 [Odynerus spinipes]|uniref:Uncharacterized protein n=1 Tax=Odynerus spinipes TaxID=1348599 RepID=A0AAD9R8U1_9HYME|nr:hypothetical protein KPH14_008164 [Odynerus spinipes]
MENIASTGKKKIQDSRVWKRTQSFVSRRRAEKSRYLDNLKILDTSVMTKKFEDTGKPLRNPSQLDERENDSHILPIGSYKTTTDNATLNYLREHNPCLPYSINTVHLQNPYKVPQRLEGYASRDNGFKVLQ